MALLEHRDIPRVYEVRARIARHQWQGSVSMGGVRIEAAGYRTGYSRPHMQTTTLKG